MEKTYPIKGDIVILTIDGHENFYKVLNIDNGIAELLSMFEPYTEAVFNSYRETTTCNNLEVLKYADSDLDHLLNEVWYNTLSNEAKTAIVPKAITQDIWYWGKTDDPIYNDIYTVDSSILYRYSIAKYPYSIEIGNRNVYALSIQENLDYIGVHPGVDNDLLSAKLSDLYYNLSKHPMTYPATGKHHIWLRDGSANERDWNWRIGGENTWIGNSCSFEILRAVRPAFKIDLSKIDFTIK